MLKHYLLIIFRNFFRNKLYTFINISGLAIGFASCIMICLWVQNELSYDRFHEKSHRIYRVERELLRDNVYSRWPITSGAYKQGLIDDFPEILSAVRFWPVELSIRDSRDFVHRQALFAVDNSIFKIFDFELEKGDEQTALIRPMSIVLTRENALKYFGTDDVLDRSLYLEWYGELRDFTITGIMKEIPRNSHIHFDMLVSISSYSDDVFSSWRSNYLYTYVLTKEDVTRNELEEKLKVFVNKRLESYYGDLLTQEHKIHEVLKLHLFPITDIHLFPSPNWEIGDSGNIASVYIFSSIAILVLIIACLNFMNLSTATANKRAKEVGLRKTVGAHKNQLGGQFILESIFLASLALIFALAIISFFIPVFNSFFNAYLSMTSMFTFTNLMILIAITFITGIFAGLYPAFYLTKFDPVTVLKRNVFAGSRKSIFRRNMVVIQFIISVTLIIGTLTVYKQMKYIQEKSLGFDKENTIFIPVRSQQVIQKYENFKNELMRYPQIQSIAVSSDLPGETLYSTTNFASEEQNNDHVSLIILMTGYNFVNTYRMDMVAGRNFSKEFSTGTVGNVILNEAAVKRFGWNSQNAIGKKLSYFRDTVGEIVGVVKDFNFRSLHTEIEPMALILDPNDIDAISIRIEPGDIKKTLDTIQQEWGNIFSGELFEFSFLDHRMDQLYENEMKMQHIFIIFSCLSILVACLGLFGLSVYIAAERRKEIGIRKVMGAQIFSLISLLSTEFLKWIVLANILACPIAWYAMNKWLQNFAYRAEITAWPFIAAGLAALVIALLTMSWQAIRAATANPVESLRYE